MADNDAALDLRRRARRRLIGAIALVLALVIVPPWIMDLEPRPVTTDLKVEIPPQDTNRLKPPAAVGKAARSRRGAGKPDAPPAAAAKPRHPPYRETQKPRRPSPATKADAVARAAPAAKGADAKRAEAILNAEGFVVQLGVFADRENARSSRRGSRRPASSHTYRKRGGGGRRADPRPGRPYPTREAAEQVRER